MHLDRASPNGPWRISDIQPELRGAFSLLELFHSSNVDGGFCSIHIDFLAVIKLLGQDMRDFWLCSS